MFLPLETLYRGQRNGRTGINAVFVMLGRSMDRTLHPGPSQAIVNHSPNGFEWGYGGSGPAQLALGILYDFTRDAGLADQQHDAFKWAYVAEWHEPAWQISGAEIVAWLQSVGAAISNDDIPQSGSRK